MKYEQKKKKRSTVTRLEAKGSLEEDHAYPENHGNIYSNPIENLTRSPQKATQDQSI
jgi:hypothetical protein